MIASHQQARGDKCAFTLIELILVVAIICTLTAILFPVFAGARKAGKRTMCMSNLRQCGTAVLMYADAEGGAKSLPTFKEARALLTAEVTCDTADNWRQPCAEEFGEPLLGSYGYVRAVERFRSPSEWHEFMTDNHNPALFVCIHHADRRVPPFHGDVVSLPPPKGTTMDQYTMPNHLLVTRLDTSAKNINVTSVDTRGTRLLMSWDAVFSIASDEH